MAQTSKATCQCAYEYGLAVRGDDESIGSPRNGNYLGMLEILAECDDFLMQHIQNHANRGSGHTNYLSSAIFEELVRLMGNQVLSEIISRINCQNTIQYLLIPQLMKVILIT